MGLKTLIFFNILGKELFFYLADYINSSLASSVQILHFPSKEMKKDIKKWLENSDFCINLKKNAGEGVPQPPTPSSNKRLHQIYSIGY